MYILLYFFFYVILQRWPKIILTMLCATIEKVGEFGLVDCAELSLALQRLEVLQMYR